MTKNDTINAALQTLGTAFVAGAVGLIATNIWEAVGLAVVGIVAFVAYELLP